MPDAIPRRHPAALRSRQAIIAASHRMLSANPHVSLTDIAEEAGVGRATLYRHFPTRDALLDTLIDAWRVEIEEQFTALQPAGAEADILTMSAIAVSVMYNHRGVWRNPEIQERRVASQLGVTLVNAWSNAVDRAIAEGVVRSDVPKQWVITTVFAVLSAAVDAVADGKMSLEEAQEFASKLVLDGVRAPGR